LARPGPRLTPDALNARLHSLRFQTLDSSGFGLLLFGVVNSVFDYEAFPSGACLLPTTPLHESQASGRSFSYSGGSGNPPLLRLYYRHPLPLPPLPFFLQRCIVVSLLFSTLSCISGGGSFAWRPTRYLTFLSEARTQLISPARGILEKKLFLLCHFLLPELSYLELTAFFSGVVIKRKEGVVVRRPL